MARQLFAAETSPRTVRLALGKASALFLTVFALIGFGLSGCALTAGSNSPPSGSGMLSTGAASLGFGNVVVGSIANQSATLTNTGSSTVNVTQATTSNSDFTMPGLTLPMSLGAGKSVSVQVAFTPKVTGAESATLSVVSDATNSPLSMPLSGSGVEGQVAATPASVNLGGVLVGSSGSQLITLSNAGTASLTITGASASGAGFSMSGLSLPTTLNAGTSTSFTASFTPTTAGSASGSIQIISNAPGSPMNIPLTGTGVAASSQLTASPTAVAFGSVTVGSSGSQTITLTNSGSASITISAASASGTGFSMSGLSLPATLSADTSTSFTASFTPTATGSASGSIRVTSNASNPSMTIALSGTGIQPQITATPASVSFGNVTVGNSGSQLITLNNTGTASLTITGASASGTGFSMSGLFLPVTVAVGQNVTLTAKFTPTAAGSASGSIQITSNAPGSPMNIPLTGTGVAASLILTANPTSITFGDVVAGQSTSATLTLTNTGNATVTISQVTLPAAPYTISGITANQTITAGGSATVTVTFAPTTTGSFTGDITITSNATNSPTSIALAGGSHSVSLSWTASTSTVVGYNVYRGTVSGGPYTLKLNSSLVTTTSYTDLNVTSGQTYYYVVTAADSSGNESVYSNQAGAIIPTP